MKNIKKHSKLIISTLFLGACFILYFINMGEYPLIDTTETKFVSIARDMLNANNWIDLKLNGNDYFETPPMLFWLINLSFLFFGKISTIAARTPSVILLTIGIITSFLAISKILTKTYASTITLILMTSFGVILFSRLATVGITFSVFSILTLLFSYLALLSKKGKRTIVFWILIYLFSSLAILTGGLFGLIPLLIVYAIYIFAGKQKEAFHPVNVLLGLVIMSVTILPWFYVMLEKNGVYFVQQFLKEYSITSNLKINNIFYSIYLFIIGFLPWSFSFLWIIFSRLKNIINSVLSYFKDNSQEKLKEKWNKLEIEEKFLSINTIAFFTTLIFSIIFGAKFLALNLFMMFPAACIAGYYWYEYMFRKKHNRSIFIATIIPNILFIVFSFVTLFGHNYINKLTTTGYTFLIIPLVVIFFIIPLFSIFSVVLQGRKLAYIANLILMFSLSFVLTPYFFNFISNSSGQNELIKFAIKANSENKILSTFTPSQKYSLVYYYDNNIDFHKNTDLEWLKAHLNNNKTSYVVVEIKDLFKIEDYGIKYELVDSGKRYCLIKYSAKNNATVTNEKPEINIY